MNCAKCSAELNLGDARSTVLRLMAQRSELLEALHGEATEIDGQPCWCSQPNMIKYRGHDSGCESNRELVKRAEGES